MDPQTPEPMFDDEYPLSEPTTPRMMEEEEEHHAELKKASVSFKPNTFEYIPPFQHQRTTTPKTEEDSDDDEDMLVVCSYTKDGTFEYPNPKWKPDWEKKFNPKDVPDSQMIDLTKD